MKMKAITAVCNTGASVPGISNNNNGRIHRSRTSSDGENAEIKMYLSKLKDLVPYMPKNRKLSKLEIIQNVIDYICDLQSELETHPIVGNNVLNLQQQFHNQQQHQQQLTQQQLQQFDTNNVNHQQIIDNNRLQQNQYNNNLISSHNINLNINNSISNRQPLADKSSPNTILTSPIAASEHHHHNYHHYHPQQQQQQQQQQHQQQQQQQQINSHTTIEKLNLESR